MEKTNNPVGSSNLCKCGHPYFQHREGYCTAEGYRDGIGIMECDCKKFQSMEEKDERKNM